ncbi:MAG: hypothetical protein FJ014_02315 [Chloroflexi bacterium]|nr:hypothetical protein [Chloroflexota bacterium]
MAERLMEAIDRDLMLDTPFLRRIREEARAEGRMAGRAEGHVEGLEEGLTTLRQSILDVLAARFDPSVTYYRRIEAQLETIADPKQLRSVLQAAIRATDVADFEQTLGTLAVSSQPVAVSS